jgi:MFS family permease
MQLLSVGWLVRDLTEGSNASAFLVVTIGGLNTLPGLFIGPLGGVLGDRVDRRKLIISIQTFMAALALSFAFLVRSGNVEVWHAYAYVIISGACLTVTQPMRQALIANTVPREALGNAYATNVLTIPGTRIVGPFIGGILIATLGFFWNFTIESLLYVGMIVAFLPMKTPYYERRKAAEQPSMFTDLKEGIVYVWKENRVILKLTLLMVVPNVFLQPLMFLLPVFTPNVLGRGADVGGFLLSVNGLGGFLGVLFIASFGFVFRKGMICLCAAIFSSLLCLVFAQSQWLALAFVIIAVYGASQTIIRTTNGTLIQTLTPDRLRGRITSLQRYIQGFVVVSSILLGLFASLTSVTIALTVTGLIGLTLALIFFFTSKEIRQLE